MNFLFENTSINKIALLKLAEELKRDKEALLQLLLALCKKGTLNRIENCPTFPVIKITEDLGDRMSLFNNSIKNDPYKISYILSILFEYATNVKQRKNYGQYFTPIPVAKHAVTHLDETENMTIIDPGCGTGIFPITIILKNITKTNLLNTIKYLGIENDPILALSSAISLDWIDAPNSWRILYANYLHVDKALLRQINVRNIDTIIANPPYVRVHRISDKQKLSSDLGLNSHSGLHTFFLAHSSRLLNNGRMIFLLPLEMTSTRYGSELLEELKHKFSIQNEIMYLDKNNLWQVAELTKIPISEFKELNSLWNIMILNSQIKKTINKKSEKIMVNNQYITISSVAKVHRGISTGANAFFVLNEDLIKKYNISDTFLKKIMPTKISKKNLPDILYISDWYKYKSQEKPCWLLSIPSHIKYDDLSNDIKEYLRMGVRNGIHLRPTSKARNPWYSVRVSDPPDLLFTYISHGYPRFIFNEAKVLYLTNLLGIYLKKFVKIKNHYKKDFINILNDEIKSWIDNNPVGRKYSGGLLKFEPGDLIKLPIAKSSLNEIEIILPLDKHLNASSS